MLNEQNKNLCWQILAKYGCESQLTMVIEECAELQKTVCKIHRDDGHVTEQHDADFREELIDTIVMCQQMLLMLKISMDEVNQRAHDKMVRALGGESEKH